MSHSTNPPTKREAERIERMLRLGCIITRLRFQVYSPAECHHIVEGRKRLGHWFTLPLNPYFHRGVITDRNTNTRDMIAAYGASLAHGSKLFVQSHGKTELDFWKIVQRLLGLDDTLPSTKIVPRRVA